MSRLDSPGSNLSELVLEHELDAVPQSRRFVRATLQRDYPNLVEDAELVASELVTNALLHGQPPVTLRLKRNGLVRLEVEDHGRAAPILLQHNTDAMTGRGLSMVAALSKGWGVESAGPSSKVVWAELGGQMPTAGSQPQVDIDELLASWTDDDADPDLVTVRLGPVSTELLLAAKAHMDNVVRELTLMREGRSGEEVPPEIADLIQSVTVDFADARTQIKRRAAAAAADRKIMTELDLLLAPSLATAGERYLAALDEADRWARSAHLLTLAPPPVHRIFRQWYVQSVVDTLKTAAAKSPTPAIRPFQMILAERVSELSNRADASSRLAVLQAVTRDLTRATTAVEMARVVADHAVRSLGVLTARVRLLDGDVLRSVVWRGRAGEPEPDSHPDVPVDSELPGAVVLRTGRHQYVRSLGYTMSKHPSMPASYPPDRSGHVVPLQVGSHKIGILTLTFTNGELAGDTESAIVVAMADVLAEALRRAELTKRAEEQREILSFLADATEIMLTAREPTDVLERLVTLAVPRLGDWCTVYLADGDVLRRVAIAIDGFADIGPTIRGQPLPLAVDVPQTRAFKTGTAVPIPAGAGRLLQFLYPGLDFAAIGGDPDESSGLCVPIVLRGRTLGVIGLTYLRSRRQVTPGVVETLTGLGARAAIALGNTQRLSDESNSAATLVSALLPSHPPVIEGLEIVARYTPATADMAGDWWEAETLADGTVLIGVGDAPGRGLPAVSRMAELRHGARALAVIETSPAAVLSALGLGPVGSGGRTATAIYGRVEPATGHLCWASAGHLPPILARPGAGADILADLPEPSQDHELWLRAGETLVLYSDGVLHPSGPDSPQGADRAAIERLRDAVSVVSGLELAALADRIMTTTGADGSDDACLLLVRKTG